MLEEKRKLVPKRSYLSSCWRGEAATIPKNRGSRGVKRESSTVKANFEGKMISYNMGGLVRISLK